MRKIMLLAAAAVILSSAVSYGRMAGGSIGSLEGNVPRPRLIHPVGESVELEGKKAVKFRWGLHRGVGLGGGRRYFEFRLYEGYDLAEQGLVFKRDLYGDRGSLKVDAGLFEAGRTYTWSLRQCYKGRGKSDRSTHSFKIIK